MVQQALDSKTPEPTPYDVAKPSSTHGLEPIHAPLSPPSGSQAPDDGTEVLPAFTHLFQTEDGVASPTQMQPGGGQSPSGQTVNVVERIGNDGEPADVFP